MSNNKNKQKKPLNILPEGQPAQYGIRKTFNHVIPRKKKRVNSLVRMKPLKQRQIIYEVPQFCPRGYSKHEFDIYRQQFERIRELTKDDLKQILKINKQQCWSQMRQSLLDQCADGYALGRIPICPHCFGTNPVFDKNKGTYLCPGYKEGDTFIKCDSTLSREQLPRSKTWNNNFQLREAKRLQRTQKKLVHQRIYQIQYKKNKKKRLQQKMKQKQTQRQQSQTNDEKKQHSCEQSSTKRQASSDNQSQKVKVQAQRQKEKEIDSAKQQEQEQEQEK